MRVTWSILAAFVIMNASTFLVYGAASAVLGLQPPAEGSPGQFMASVLLVKAGIAIGFISLLTWAKAFWIDKWFAYALIWLGMFAIIELGQAIAPGYSAIEAGAGIVAESIYFPLSSFVASRLLVKNETKRLGAA